MDFKEIMTLLKEKGKTIAMMESCTGGSLAGAVTDFEGASDVFSFGAVTYSNEYKIKLGVSKEIIDTYSVYSKETAEAMAQAIAFYANASYGIGITGKLNRVDKNNPLGNDQEVFISIYERDKQLFHTWSFKAIFSSRRENKNHIIGEVFETLKEVIK